MFDIRGSRPASVVAGILLAAMIALEPGSARAQQSAGGAGMGLGSIGLVIGVPQGEFHENVGNVGIGLSGDIMGRIAGSPLLVGGSLGFMIYGSERRREPFSTTIPDVTVDVITSNNILLGHFLMRLQPPVGSVRPYAEGLVGFKYFFTQTRIESEGFDSEDPIAESTNLDDFAFSYGGGIGLAIRLWDSSAHRLETGEGIFSGLLDLRLRYLLGSEAEYLKKGSIDRTGGVLTYDIQRSKTDMLNVYIGISLVF